MAKIIEFYLPNNFRENSKWIPRENRGKIVEFTLAPLRPHDSDEVSRPKCADPALYSADLVSVWNE